MSRNSQSPLIQIRSFYSKYIAALEESWETLSLPISDAAHRELDTLRDPKAHVLVGDRNAINLTVFQILQDQLKRTGETIHTETDDDDGGDMEGHDDDELSNDEDHDHGHDHHPIYGETTYRRLSLIEESAFEQEKRDIVMQLEKSSLMTAKHYQEVNRKRHKSPVNFLGPSPFVTKYEEADPEKIPVRPDPDVLLTVQFQHSDQLGRKTVEYLVLGHQLLTALKDVIECRWDHILEGPQMLNSFFLIENAFYSDMRHPSMTDLSQGIREWAEERRIHDPSLPVYHMHRMEDINFIDLAVRLNVPYVYVHQGNCEHVFVIRDMRLMHPRDCRDAQKYPKKIFRGKMSRRTCTMCRLCPAKHVTIGDKLAPDYVCYFCDSCYDLFHYDEEGVLIYEDFTVYPYYGE